eukprot:6179999-Pyramimonas_sp.AAC.1
MTMRMGMMVTVRSIDSQRCSPRRCARRESESRECDTSFSVCHRRVTETVGVAAACRNSAGSGSEKRHTFEAEVHQVEEQEDNEKKEDEAARRGGRKTRDEGEGMTMRRTDG